MMQHEHIAQYQQQIDNHIKKLGGYWRSISALARLNEEVGELGELLLQDRLNIDEIGTEIADIFIISTCIANQYLNYLDEEYTLIGAPVAIRELQNLQQPSPMKDRFILIAQRSGKIARIINHYEGDKPKKHSEKPMRLGHEIATLHRQLLFLAHDFDLNVFRYIDRVLAHSATRDKGRFNITHDPTTEASRTHFLKAMEHHYAQFLCNAKIWGSYEWDPEASLPDNLRHSLPSFIRFTKCAAPEGLDGYVFEFPVTADTPLFEHTIAYLAGDSAKTIDDRNQWCFTFQNTEVIATALPYEENDQHTQDRKSDFLYIRLLSSTCPPWE